jgi:hypothetical protein
MKDCESPTEALPTNFGNPVLRVQHRDLTRSDADSAYRSRCLVCDKGVLPMRRDLETFALLADDTCLFCGQRYQYLDIEKLRQGPGA